MKLYEFIKKHGVKNLAEKIGTSPMYLRQIAWGKASPSFRMAAKIVEATNRQVGFEDLINKNCGQKEKSQSSSPPPQPEPRGGAPASWPHRRAFVYGRV